MRMKAKFRKVLSEIQACTACERYLVSKHFTQRMDRRGLFWPDIQDVIASPSKVQDAGFDKIGRKKWILSGRASDGLKLEVVCILDFDDNGNIVVFITVYWKD